MRWAGRGLLTEDMLVDAPANLERPSPATVRSIDLLLEHLVRAGVDTFFGIPGGAIAPMYDALRQRSDVRVFHARHETGATFAALGYARATGRIPGVLLTSGPGITNAMTGLAAARAEGQPMVVLAGEVPRSKYGRGALQEGSRYELDVLDMVSSSVRYAAELCSPLAVPWVLLEALRVIDQTPGPAFLSLPLDVVSQHVTTDVTLATPQDVANELATATRPLIVVGSGARRPEAIAAVHRIARSTGAPVATSPKAKGVFPESSARSLGVLGYGGHRSVSEYLASNPDVVFAVGAGLSEVSTNNWDPKLKPTRCFIAAERDLGRLGRNYAVNLALVGSAESTLPQVADALPAGTRPPLAGGVIRDPFPASDVPGRIHPAAAIRCIQACCPEDTIYTVDVGEHTLFALHYLQVDRPDTFIAALGFGSMGSGIGAAVGAGAARLGRTVVSICGDYGFQMNGMELATCVSYGFDVVFIVFNDARMRMVEAGLCRIFGSSMHMHDGGHDFAAVAEGLGARGIRVSTVAELEAALGKPRQGPLVIDVLIDPTATFANNGRAAEVTNFCAK